MRVMVKKGDITESSADAIVNAANSSLLGGGGVDGAIHRKAGQELKEECRRIRLNDYPDGLPIGEAVATDAYSIPVKKIIHTVGPRKGKDEVYLLKDCYSNSLKLAESLDMKSIAFPAISTGAYGVSVDESLAIVRSFIEEYRDCDMDVHFVLFDEDTYERYKKYLSDLII